jgi:LemA protein
MTTALVVVALVLTVPALAYAASYNRFVSDCQQVIDAWAAIDVELQRRHQLVPKLVDVVRAAAAHERGLLTELASRNALAARAPRTAVAQAPLDPPIRDLLARVLDLREAYPALNAQQSFVALQRELATTEDRIAAARRFYNTRVVELNRRIEAFPSSIVARRHRIAAADYFEA